MRKRVGSVFCILIVVLFSYWTVKPLFQSGFFPMHDDTQPSRVHQMAKALSFGQFPVRWVGDLGYGYGYPLFNFYAPLPYYVGAIFDLSGFDAITATKIMFVVGVLMSGVAMFLLLNRITNNIAAIVGSLLYMYAPYHAVDIYVRGAVGELYAYGFLPLVLLGFYKIVSQDSPRKQGIVIGVLGLAGVLLSHNIIGMITGYLVALALAVNIIYLIIKKKQLSAFRFPLSAFLLGLGLSAFFILPAFAEKNFTRVGELAAGTNNFANHFVYLDQLWSSPWGYAGSAPGRADGMSFMIGKMHVLLGLLAVGLFLIFNNRKKLNNFQFSIFNFQLIILLLSIFFMLEQSKFVWDLLPGFPFIQYPWRFLVFASFSLSVIAAAALGLFGKNERILLAVIIVAATVWFNSRYFVPKEYFPLQAEDYTSELILKSKISKISDEYLSSDFIIPKSPQGIALQVLTEDSNMKIIDFQDTFTKKSYKVSVNAPFLAQTNIAYFPGWQAKIDSQPAKIQTRDGRIELYFPSGLHNIEFEFQNTPIRALANAISILALILVVYIIIL